MALPAMAGGSAEYHPRTVKHKMLVVSQFILAGAISADMGSSFGLREVNPVGGPSGIFGPRQAMIMGGLSGASLVAQMWLEHKHPRSIPDNTLMFVNYGAAAFHGWAAWHNIGQHDLSH